MHVKELKVKIATYLQRDATEYVVDGVDLLLATVNDSHREAQKQYDFEYSKCDVDALVDLQVGCPISPLALHGTSELVTVKKVLDAFVTDVSGNDRPIKYISRSAQIQDLRERWYGIPTPFAPVQRDMPAYPTFYETYLVQSGQTLFMYPSATVVFPQNPVPVYIQVIRLWPDYKDEDENTDFLLQYGSDWLMWDAICRLNPLNKEFVQRQEGNVPVPTQERDKAWQNLLSWDAQLVTTGDSFVNLD